MPVVRAPVAHVVRRAFPPQVAIHTAASTRGLPLAPTVGCSRHRHRRAAPYAHAQSRTSPASEAPTMHPRYRPSNQCPRRPCKAASVLLPGGRRGRTAAPRDCLHRSAPRTPARSFPPSTAIGQAAAARWRRAGRQARASPAVFADRPATAGGNTVTRRRGRRQPPPDRA